MGNPQNQQGQPSGPLPPSPSPTPRPQSPGSFGGQAAPPADLPSAPPPRNPRRGGGQPGQGGKFNVRTMTSDAQSVQGSGGGSPRPYVPASQSPQRQAVAGGPLRGPQSMKGGPRPSRPKPPAFPSAAPPDSPPASSTPSSVASQPPSIPSSPRPPRPNPMRGNVAGGGGAALPTAGFPPPKGSGSPIPPPPPVSPPGARTGNNDVFKPPQVEPTPLPSMGDVSDKTARLPSEGAPRSGSPKKIIAFVLTIIIVLGVGVVGYFYVFPLVAGRGSDLPVVGPFLESEGDVPSVPEVPSEPVTITPAPPVEIESEVTVPEVPSIGEEAPPVFAGDSGDDTATAEGVVSGEFDQVGEEEITGGEAVGSEGEGESIIEVPVPEVLSHTSFLSTAADLTSEMTLGEINVANIRDEVGFSTVEVSSLKEVVFKDSDDGFIPLSGIAKVVAPTLFTDEVIALFEADFTYAAYTDSKGSWPVYVMKIKSDTDAALASSKIAQIENMEVSEAANLFLSDPGDGASWKDGQAEGVVGRYNSFTQDGASLNYGWKGDVLIIGASYSAYKEVIKRL